MCALAHVEKFAGGKRVADARIGAFNFGTEMFMRLEYVEGERDDKKLSFKAFNTLINY